MKLGELLERPQTEGGVKQMKNIFRDRDFPLLWCQTFGTYPGVFVLERGFGGRSQGTRQRKLPRIQHSVQ